MKVWLVWKSIGEYSDRIEECEAVCETEAIAEDIVRRVRAVLKGIRRKSYSEQRRMCSTDVTGLPFDVDPCGEGDSYFVVEMPVIDQPPPQGRE